MERPQDYGDLQRLVATVRAIAARDPAKAPACRAVLARLAVAEHRLRLEWRASQTGQLLGQAQLAIQRAHEATAGAAAACGEGPTRSLLRGHP